MRTFVKWAVLVALLYIPMVYFVAAFALSMKAPKAATVVELTPYAVAIVLLAYLVKGRARWRSTRGLVALPLVGIGYGGIGVAFVSLVIMTA